MQDDLIRRSDVLKILEGKEIKIPQLRYAEGYNTALRKCIAAIKKIPAYVHVKPL